MRRLQQRQLHRRQRRTVTKPETTVTAVAAVEGEWMGGAEEERELQSVGGVVAIVERGEGGAEKTG